MAKIIRAHLSGTWYVKGSITSDGDRLILTQAIKVYSSTVKGQWGGATDLAIVGPSEARVSGEVDVSILASDAIEVLEVSEAAKLKFDALR